MLSIPSAESFCKVKRSGKQYYLTTEIFQIKGLEVTVIVTLNDCIKWDIDIAESDWYYVEWIDFPRASVSNDIKRSSGFLRLYGALKTEKPEK